jgi:hypothetical protein
MADPKNIACNSALLVRADSLPTSTLLEAEVHQKIYRGKEFRDKSGKVVWQELGVQWNFKKAKIIWRERGKVRKIHRITAQPGLSGSSLRHQDFNRIN